LSVAWATLNTQTNQSFTNRFQTIQYPIANTNSYVFYRLNITANNGDCCGLQLSEMAFTFGTNNPPSVPSGLTGVSGSNQVLLSWQAAPNAVSYNVKRALVSGGPYTTVETGIVATNYTDFAVIYGGTYYYVVSGVNYLGESANSLEAGVTVVTPPTHIPATNACAVSSSITFETGSEGQDMGYITNGCWATFCGVNFGGRTLSLKARVASATSGGTINVRLGTTNGPLVGVLTVTNTGGWQIYTNVSTALTNVSGVQDVVLQFVGKSGYLLNVIWIEFTPVSTLPLQLNWQPGVGQLQFNWLSDHIGWLLQGQTNPPSVGLGTNWFTVSGSDGTNLMDIPINPTNGSAFYRLIYPY
jgi:hypothetical protein